MVGWPGSHWMIPHPMKKAPGQGVLLASFSSAGFASMLADGLVVQVVHGPRPGLPLGLAVALSRNGHARLALHCNQVHVLVPVKLNLSIRCHTCLNALQ